MKSFYLRLLLLISLISGSIYLLLPSLYSHLPGKKISLGLDLQGGVYLVLGIDFPKVFQEELKKHLFQLEQELKKENPFIVIEPSTQKGIIKGLKKESFPKHYLQTFKLEEKSQELIISLKDIYKEKLADSALERSIEILRNRIDQFGVSEPEITSLGQDKIVVLLPGLKDIERAKNLIGQTAQLSFNLVTVQSDLKKLVDDLQVESSSLPYPKYIQLINSKLEGKIPKNSKIVFEKKNDFLEPHLIEPASLLGEDLDQAAIGINPESNMPYVSLTFNTSGARKMAEVTTKSLGRLMAIVLDDKVFSVAGLRTPITNGQAMIEMGRHGDYEETLKQAKDLALVLKAGSLPVKLEFQEERLVGPSLGSDSIQLAKKAALFSCLFVFIFMILYYKIAGVIATFTLILNALFILAILVLLEATLTLPGIAGLALTIGMAVDANIILYERIKQELKTGTSFKKAFNYAYEKSFWTIFDANITTIMAGLALLSFGTGPLKGFAVTLIAGIVINIYACYFASKVIFELILLKKEKVLL